MKEDAVASFTDPLKRIRGLESATEKLLHNTTLSILVFLFILLASKPLFGSPISCQVPKDWPSASVDYFTDVCYYGQREKVGINQVVNRGHGRGTMTVNILTGTSDFYMWLPFLPIFHGALCLLPVFFWKFIGLECFNGLDIVSFLEFFETNDPDKVLDETESWRCQKLAVQFNEWITTKRTSKFGLSQTMILYVFMKWFRFGILLFQFWLTATFFSDRNVYWGYETLIDMIQGRKINKLHGEFTLISGCRVQRFQMGIDPGSKNPNNVYNARALCVLSSNFFNAKAFLFLYWWFLFVSLVSLVSALLHTVIIFVPFYRKYVISSMIRSEEYFVEKFGEPHKNLHVGQANPIDHFVDYLGNDGLLVIQMIYDMLHHYACDQFVEYTWIHVIVNNGKEIRYEIREKEEKLKKGEPPIVPDTEIDGGGDRYRGGKNHSEKKKNRSPSIEPKDSTSCATVSLSRVSQPSLLLSETEEEPLINPSLFSSLSV